MAKQKASDKRMRKQSSASHSSQGVFFLCHVQIIESEQETCIKLSRKEYSRAMNFRKVVLSHATIQNSRIVITNGMISFEHNLDSINMNRVRVKKTNLVYTIERRPSVTKLHS